MYTHVHMHPPTHTHTHTHTYTHTHTHTQCGELSDIRLIKTKGGKSGRANIYAYIEFSSPVPVQRALGLDRSDMNGRPMFVSPFPEKGGGRGGGGGNHPKVGSAITLILDVFHALCKGVFEFSFPSLSPFLPPTLPSFLLSPLFSHSTS